MQGGAGACLAISNTPTSQIYLVIVGGLGLILRSWKLPVGVAVGWMVMKHSQTVQHQAPRDRFAR